MTESLDLNLLPIARYGGRDYPELLGLHFAEPPRRPARGRNLDRLVLYLVLEGNAPLPADRQDQMLADLTKLYYQTSGSVTAALRATANELNRLLLERNRQLGGNRQSVGHLIQVVLREERVTIALSGLLHAILISGRGIEHYHDPDLAGRGLGLAKAASVSFSLAALRPNDTLILTAQPAPEWRKEVLASVHGQGPESLRRRLFYQTSADLNAVALQAKQGKGKFYLLWSQVSQPAVEPAEGKGIPAPISAPAAPVQPQEKPAQPQEEPPQPEEALESSATPEPAPASEVDLAATGPASEPQAAQPPSAAQAPESVPLASPARPAIPAGSPDRRSGAASAAGVFARAGASAAAGGRQLAGGLRTLLGRMLPDEAFVNIPSGVMAMVAIAVPVVIVTIASMAYFRLGRTAQYELLSTQARQVALQAMEQTDQGQKRSDLGLALTQLQKAEAYATTSEAKTEIESLRAQVRNALDELDFVRRVSYESAIIGGIPVTSNIIAMTAFDDELYMLDQTSGNVLRAYLTDQGYEMDYTFQCSPGVYGEVSVGTIVKIIAWPSGYEPAAKVLAIDASGSALYCQPDKAPTPERLAPGGEGGWGNVLSATLDQGDVYVLDLPSNGVWIYGRGNLLEPPTIFFDEAVPPLQDVTDMLVDRDDLYLLQSDGNMMICVRDTLLVAPTRCSIQSYMDRRPGRENLPLVPPVPFLQVTSTAPPDPSLYLLEPKGQAIYHFSLRNLVFQKQFLSQNPLPSRNATAFAINQSRRYLYMALGSQIFYAAMP